MARVRTEGALFKAVTNKKDWNAPPPLGDGKMTVNQTYIHESRAQGFTKTIVDVVTPGFKKLREQGVVIMSPVTISTDRRTTVASSHTFDAAGTPVAIWGKRLVSGEVACAWSNPPVRPLWFATRKADAAKRTLLLAHDKVAKEEFMSLVTVAEAHKTASMIARPFGAADDLISRIAARKLQLIKRGLTAVKAAIQAYLEYRFGWKPLLHDMEGIWKAYIDNTSYRDKPVRLVARSGDDDIHWNSGGVTKSARLEGCTATMSAEYDHEAAVYSGVLYELHDASLEDATARRMGLRLADVPGSLWEAIPMSFVIDRFVDVGKWLYAIQPKPGVTIKGSWTTTKDIQRNYHKVVDTEATIIIGPNSATLKGGAGGTFSEEIRTMNRVANPVLSPIPTINYRDLNLIQQIDHAALITQRLLGLGVGNLRI